MKKKIVHWTDSTSRGVNFKLSILTMCGKQVADESCATRNHRDVTCDKCMSAMDDWTTARWHDMVHRCTSGRCTPERCDVTGGGVRDLEERKSQRV